MGKNNAQARRYLREVRSQLPCSGRQKKEIMGKIQASLMEYLQEKPEAGYEEISEKLGAPGQIASAYVDEMGAESVVKSLHIRRKIVGTVCLAVAIGLVLWLGMIGLVLINHKNNDKGYLVVEIIEDDSVTEKMEGINGEG